MSLPPSQPSSRNSRKRSHTIASESSEAYTYQDLSLNGSEPANPLHLSYQQPGSHYHQDFSQFAPPAGGYLATDTYQNATKSKVNPGVVTASADDGSQLYSDSAHYYPRQAQVHTMMMSQRDMGYGYMPAPPMQNPLQYSSGPSYPNSLAPLPGYYSEPQQHHRSYSGSSRPSSLPVLDFQPLGSEESDPSLSSRKRRRTSQHDARRQNKLRVRRNQLPSILDLGGKGSDFSSGPVDIYPAASAPSTYVNDRPTMSPPYRNDYNDPQSGHSSYVSPPYHQTNYSMGPMNPGSLAPPLLPNNSQGYSQGRSSPLLQAPLPPATAVSQHVEPVVVGGGREKPQCWDHGCNGREFSTFSNLLRHQREKSGSATKSYCPHCGAEFTRTTARNGHMEHGKCKTRKGSDSSQTKR